MSALPMILVVDDEDQILRMLRPTLEAEGYRVQTATTGANALEVLRDQPISAVVLDLGLPDMDGKAVIEAGGDYSSAPIIVLSARGSDAEKIAALDAGAQDYLAKPFSVGELMARLRVLLRPARLPAAQQVVTVRGALFDFRARRVKLPTREVWLSGRENEFLRLLASQPDEVVTHREIIFAIWGNLAHADAQFVRVLAGQVRQKLEDDPSRPRMVVTVPGVGYRFGSAL